MSEQAIFRSVYHVRHSKYRIKNESTVRINVFNLSFGEKQNQTTGMFLVGTANNWMDIASNKAVPKMLFSEFWFEGELSILFADTNLGKSILAVQIGESISKGEAIENFKLEAEKQRIVYFDFELSAKQFQNRYSIDYTQLHKFDDNFIRVEINADAEWPDSTSFEKILYDSLEKVIIQTKAKIVIIDNLTYLKTNTENAKDALPLMKHLKALKTKYELSILALAHTPKRDLSKPITNNDLQGSKMLMNFCDSSFTIGASNIDKSIRYLKQIKQRNTEQIYDTENVAACHIHKPSNFLKFEYIATSTEKEHLKEVTQKDRSEVIQKVKALIHEGKSQRNIAAELGISLGAVNKYANM